MMPGNISTSLLFYIIISCFIESLLTQDCTSCKPINVVCDPEASSKGTQDGIFTQSTTTDSSGCKVVTLNCKDDADSGALSFMQTIDGYYFFMPGDKLVCGDDGKWIPGVDLELVCDVDETATVSTPTCEIEPTTSTTIVSTTPTTPTSTDDTTLSTGSSDATTASTSMSESTSQSTDVSESSTTSITGSTDSTTESDATTESTASTSSSSSSDTTEAPGTCCHEWSEWIKASPCPDNCGGCGTTTYKRRCLTSDTCSCPGSDTKEAPCNRSPCPYNRKSCCGNKVPRALNKNILCYEPTEVIESPPQTCSCCPEEGIWSSWIEGTCSDTCGGYGIGVKSRTCLSEEIGCPCKGESQIEGTCKMQPCKIPRHSCATGLTVRPISGMILCTNLTDTVTTTTCCPSEGLWNQWTPWSTCPNPCGGCGNSTRTRTCASAPYGCPCIGSASETTACNRQACTTGTECCVGTSQMLEGRNVCVGSTEAIDDENPSPPAEEPAPIEENIGFFDEGNNIVQFHLPAADKSKMDISDKRSILYTKVHEVAKEVITTVQQFPVHI